MFKFIKNTVIILTASLVSALILNYVLFSHSSDYTKAGGTTASDVNLMVHKLLVSGSQGRQVIVKIIDEDNINAYIYEANLLDKDGFPVGRAVVVNVYQGLLDSMTKAEVVMVIAHEVSHFYLGHTRSLIEYADPSSQERHADTYAIALAERAGYDYCEISNSFQAFIGHGADPNFTSSHPALADRINYLKCSPLENVLVKFKLSIQKYLNV